MQGSRIGDGLDPEELRQLVDDVIAMVKNLVRVVPEELGGEVPAEEPVPLGARTGRYVVVGGYF